MAYQIPLFNLNFNDHEAKTCIQQLQWNKLSLSENFQKRAQCNKL